MAAYPLHPVPERAFSHRKARFNPLRSLDAEILSRHLDAFRAGTLREMALLMDAIEERDDIVRAVSLKRKKAVSRLPWEIVLTDVGADEALRRRAQEHRATLRSFFDHLTVTNALDENERGGVRLLVRQMMDAVGKRYAVHEIVWQPRQAAALSDGPIDVAPASPLPESAATDGDWRPGASSSVSATASASVSPAVASFESFPLSPLPDSRAARRSAPALGATLRFVPLWFFESETGKLRFLPHEGALEGEELEEGAWMVTVGDGVMVACCVAYMFKSLPMKDWLSYCERHGMPGIRGVTKAAPGSPEWQSMAEAVDNFASDFAAVMNHDESIEAIDLSAPGEIPFPAMVDRMDRAMATLWRGADLSTLSAGAGSGQGASLTEEIRKRSITTSALP
ncbi:hypothetical protein DB346_07475 [Verrucomicrobia bacterium LW23]|nr:hypothetical protein DB346_07475 [Verrucomicrobia bacterium LW23]